MKVARLIVILIMLCSASQAQLVINEIPRGMYYERTARVRKFKDMKNMRDVFHYDGLLMGRNRIMGSFSNNFGRIWVPEAGGYKARFRSQMGYFLRFRFFEEYSINLTLYQDLNKKAALPWSPHVNYSIGRYQWRPNKFNYGYENYQPNRFDHNATDWKTKFLQGYYFISYSHLLPDSLRKYTQIDSTSMLKFTYFVRYSIFYAGNQNENLGGTWMNSKPVFGFNVRYIIGRNYYVEFNPLVHLNKRTQMPWDGDFTYGVGYFDYRSFRVSASYANYGPNRWPWNRQDVLPHGFFEGNFRLAFNWVW